MRNVTTGQQDLLARLREGVHDLTVRWDDVRGVASSVRGVLARPRDQGRAADAIRTLLGGYGPLFGPPDLASTLRLLRTRTDRLGWTHLEYQQTCRTRADGDVVLDVHGARLAAHVHDGALKAVQSSCWRTVEVADASPRLDARAVHEALRRTAAPMPGFVRLAQRMKERGSDTFPVTDPPRLLVFPWQGGFRLAWSTYAYVPVAVPERPGGLEPARVFVDAHTGELLASLAFTADQTPVPGTGAAVTPLGGPYTVRNLNVVRIGGSTTHRLEDHTRARTIVTYDAGGDMQWDDLNEIAAAIGDGSLPVSENPTGSNWSTTVATSSRTGSQQPEVDAHFHLGEAYGWYDALAGGRAGWDDGNYADPPVEANLPVRVVTHVAPGTNVNALFTMRFVGQRWIPFVVLYDGDPNAACAQPGDRGVDFMAGSKQVVGHEYQHLITTFSFEDGTGKPGLGYFSWTAALHEGLSDAFGGFFSDAWSPGPEISPAGLVLRNLAFPRDPDSWMNRPGPLPCGHRPAGSLEQITKDHFADRDLPPEPPGSDTSASAVTLRRNIGYFRGTILGHCAYLMAIGGVHQRASRTPVLIPVAALGREMVGGRLVPRAARIWYRALTYYFSTHGELTGIPANDENLFRKFGEACLDAAEELYGPGSREHCGTALALHAVGLHPSPGAAAPFYGADVTFLRWGVDWRLSRPYLGGIQGTAPDWASLDLFVNNGGASEWNAVVDGLDASGSPTGFENSVYCRVRNVGDSDAQNVRVTFFYARMGTNPTGWTPVTDGNGNAQSLTVTTLAAGQSTFPDSDQDTPPATAKVKWWIPPLAVGEVVDHFCLRATVTSDNDVNPYNNEVQSNIAYVVYAPGTGMEMGFFAGNAGREEIPIDLDVQTAMPDGWRVSIERPEAKVLRGGEEALLRLALRIPANREPHIAPPFDGEVRGQLSGLLSGPCRGALTGATRTDERLSGRLAVTLDGIGSLLGRFEGRVDRETGALTGRVVGSLQAAGTGTVATVAAGLQGWLRPWRRINVSQIVRGQPVGGITIQIGRAAVAGP